MNKRTIPINESIKTIEKTRIETKVQVKVNKKSDKSEKSNASKYKEMVKTYAVQEN